MNIIVPVKLVPETTIKPKIAGDGKSVELANVKMVINPFDEFAVEEALTLCESAGAGEVTVVTVGTADDVAALRHALAMGANNAARVVIDGAPGSDSRAVASLLAAYIKGKECDLVLCGKHAVGSDGAQLPQMLATMLELPVTTSITKLDIGDGKAKAERAIEGKTEVVEFGLPAVISVDKGLNEPRYPKLKGIMAAKKATIEEVSPADLGVDAGILGEAGAMLELTGIELPPPRGEGVLIEVGDDPDGAAQKLVDWLKNDAKVI